LENSEFLKRKLRTFEIGAQDSSAGLNLVAGGAQEKHEKTSLEESRAVQRLRLAYLGVTEGDMPDEEFAHSLEEVRAQVLQTLTPLQDPQFQKVVAQRPLQYQEWVNQSRMALLSLEQALELMLSWLDSGQDEHLDQGYAQAMEAYAHIDSIQDECQESVTPEQLAQVREMEQSQDLEEAQADLC
jgi:hypothetical protein